MRKMINYLNNVYWSVIPFATFFIKRKTSRNKRRLYESLELLLETDDESLSILKRLNFFDSEKNMDLRSIHPRAKFSPDDMMPEFVEVEFETYFSDQLATITQKLSMFSDIYPSVTATYIPEQDNVLIKYGYQYEDDVIKLFTVINIIITALTIISVIGIIF